MPKLRKCDCFAIYGVSQRGACLARLVYNHHPVCTSYVTFLRAIPRIRADGVRMNIHAQPVTEDHRL